MDPAASGRLLGLQRWRVNPTVQLHWRDWGDASVAFEAISGETHLFDPLAAAVMACIEGGETSREALVATLAGDLELTDNHTLSVAVCEVLDRLKKLGWITPVLG